MKTKIFLYAFLLISTYSAAQDKTYFSIAFGKDFPLHYHVIGGYFTGNKLLGKNFYLGAGTAFLKFDNTENFYFPVFGNISFVKTQNDKKVFPIAFIQPGYGFYKHNEAGISTKGGFTFHARAGIGYPFLFHKKGFATIGFARYTFKTDLHTSERKSWGARIGMML